MKRRQGREMEPYRERGIENAVRYEDSRTRNADLSMIFEETAGMDIVRTCSWIEANREKFSPGTLVLRDDTDEAFLNAPAGRSLIICLRPFNNLRHFNVFLVKANSLLQDGGLLSLYGETSGMRRRRIESSFPSFVGRVFSAADYLWSRVMIKLTVTRRLCLALSRGRNRNFPRVEVLGRMCKAGFAICGDDMREGAWCATAVKLREPETSKPHYGILVRLPRRGKDGKVIRVFKIRTMYAYSEYIQDYAYRINGLEGGGKFKDDFRVNLTGAFWRRHFLDEIPMFINFFRGELKLVGVRPVSEQYLSLYTPEMRALHLSVKPGIFPPLYYEYPKPSDIVQIQESERRYIERYREHPFRTDVIYFFGIIRNVIFRRERSH